MSMSGDVAFRQAIVAAAIRAPSGDNCQPWRFRFTGGRMDIHLLRDRAASFFDFRDRGSYISIGAVVENVRVQAACMGLAVDVTYPQSEPETDAAVAGVSFRSGTPANDASRAQLDALHRRTVNRRPFLPFAIPAHRQREWTPEPVAGTQTTVIVDRREVARWARVTYLGDRIRWTHPAIHRELFASIRYSRDEAERLRVGLEIDRLGAGPAALPVMRALQSWPRMQRLSRFGIDRALAYQTRALVRCAGALVLVTIEDDAVSSWIRAGEQVERLWINAARQRLCVQPAPVAMYLDQRFQREGDVNFEPAHRPLLAAVRRELQGLLGKRTGAMLFRIGRGWRMGRSAVRLPPESFYDAP